MRFAGWCVADITSRAWGFNPYGCYLDDRQPDWDAILPEREGRVWGLVVADLPPDLDRRAVAAVDYEAFAARFARPLELRPVDWKRYGVFAFLFTETRREDMDELRAMLGSDLKEFLRRGDAAS
jgi:hypothetical protein